jgi:hypothetical protein
MEACSSPSSPTTTFNSTKLNERLQEISIPNRLELKTSRVESTYPEDITPPSLSTLDISYMNIVRIPPPEFEEIDRTIVDEAAVDNREIRERRDRSDPSKRSLSAPARSRRI